MALLILKIQNYLMALHLLGFEREGIRSVYAKKKREIMQKP